MEDTTNEATATFCFTVVDNCMMPKYGADSIVFIDPSTPPKNQEDVLVELENGNRIIRRMILTRNGGFLYALNDRYLTMRIPAHSKILGVVKLPSLRLVK